MKANARYELFCRIIDEIDIAYDLMYRYDSFPHQYGDVTLYQAETHIIQHIGNYPGTTVTDLSKVMDKSVSACSQIVKKLRQKDWVKQERDEENNRSYKLYLTDSGWDIFYIHEEFDQSCFKRNLNNLSRFSEEELETFLEIQKCINDSFREDLALCKSELSEIMQEGGR